MCVCEESRRRIEDESTAGSGFEEEGNERKRGKMEMKKKRERTRDRRRATVVVFGLAGTTIQKTLVERTPGVGSAEGTAAAAAATPVASSSRRGGGRPPSWPAVARARPRGIDARPVHPSTRFGQTAAQE